jgi:hypothetical protein
MCDYIVAHKKFIVNSFFIFFYTNISRFVPLLVSIGGAGLVGTRLSAFLDAG